MRRSKLVVAVAVLLSACVTDPPSAPRLTKAASAAPSKGVAEICDASDYPEPRLGWPARGPLRESPTSAQLNPAPRTAIVLIHGFQPGIAKCKDFPYAQSGEEYFSELLRVIEAEFADEARVMVFTYPTFNAFDVAAAELALQLNIASHGTVPLEHVALLGHSMGGLVAREATHLLASTYGKTDLVDGIITLGTPHKGGTQDHKLIRKLLSWIGDEGLNSAIAGISRQQEEAPIYAFAGALIPPAAGDKKAVCTGSTSSAYNDICSRLSQPNDGLVEDFSARPSFIPSERRHDILPVYDHSEMKDGNGLPGDLGGQLFPQVIADLRLILTPPTPSGWTNIAPMPIGLGGPVVVPLGGRAFTFGGAFHPGGAFSGTCCTSVVYDFDPVGNVWTERANIPPTASGRRSGSAVVSLGGEAYLTGGVAEGGILYSDLQRYLPPPVDTWTAIAGADTPVPTVGGIFGAIGPRLYLYAPTTGGTGMMLALDLASKTWTQLPSPAHGHSQGGGGVVGQRFYLVGGCEPACHSFVEVFDPVSNSWTTISASLPTFRVMFGTAVVGSKIYVVGGQVFGSGATGVTEVFDTVTESWTTGPSLNTPRFAFGLGAVGAKLYAIGGSTFFAGCPCTKTVETLDVFAPPAPALGPVVMTAGSSIASFAIAGGTIAYTDGLYSPFGTVYGVSTNGGVSGALATGLNFASAVITDGSDFFWTEGGGGGNPPGAIRRVSVSGGVVTTLATAVDGLVPYNLVADATYLYFVSRNASNGNSIHRIAKTGGAITEVVSGSAYAHRSFTVNSGTAYYLDDAGIIRRIAIAGGSSVAMTAGPLSAYGLLVSGPRLYWTNDVGPASSQGIYSIPTSAVSGTPAFQHIAGMPPHVMAIDGNSLYAGISTGLYRFDLSNLANTTFIGPVNVGAQQIAVSSAHVYWLEVSASNPPVYRILRAPK